MFTFHRGIKFAALAAAFLLVISSSAMAVTYRLGDENSEVSTIQTALKQLKFYTGSITGHYGERTEDAVKKFQQKYNLEQDGIVGADTLKLLYQKAGITSSSTSTSTSSSTSSSSSSSVLRYGSSGDAVKTLQQNLSKLGYYKGSITGHYGSKTEEAVAAFQKANSLSADGIAGAKTISAIATKAASTTTTTTTTSSSALDTSTALSEGSKSSSVTQLQKMLKSLGYYTGSITGSFGSKTKEAVIAFQKKNGLTADGIAGTKTLAAISSEYSSGSSSSSDISTGTIKVNTDSVIYSNFYNWRTKYANGTYCTVYDPATSYSWKLRIMTKDAHMDAEPATSSDTETMIKAFGGKTTWTPKVVFVKFSDGKIYIGSTHDVPHGTYHLGTNNFKGHLCVHFPLSMTQAQKIGSYATQHEEAIEAYWKKLQEKYY